MTGLLYKGGGNREFAGILNSKLFENIFIHYLIVLDLYI
jgi:hypothetical protein